MRDRQQHLPAPPAGFGPNNAELRTICCAAIRRWSAMPGRIVSDECQPANPDQGISFYPIETGTRSRAN